MTWLATLLVVAGTVLKGRYNIYGWVVSIIGSILWGSHFIIVHEYAGVAMNGVLIVFYVYGWRYWAQHPSKIA
jgi:hypothetical protein